MKISNINPKTVYPIIDDKLRKSGATSEQRKKALSIASNLIRRWNNAVNELKSIQTSAECHGWERWFV